MSTRIPALPKMLGRKIFKTGQTRGADDDEIYQNRVGRNSTVLIPYTEWNGEIEKINFEKGYIVLVPPCLIGKKKKLRDRHLAIGENALFFYETRADWETYNPDKIGLKAAVSRTAPLGGEYVARVPATTAHTGGENAIRGFTERAMKGAGIRFYEYAPSEAIEDARLQLEAQFWLCEDAIEAAILGGMREEDARTRKEHNLKVCKGKGLLDYKRLQKARILDKENITVCPFCLKRLSGRELMTKMIQVPGREVPDITITEASLFHIHELRPGEFNHRPYNLGWGHHHCNVIVKDSGIMPTLKWCAETIERNRAAGYSF